MPSRGLPDGGEECRMSLIGFFTAFWLWYLVIGVVSFIAAIVASVIGSKMLKGVPRGLTGLKTSMWLTALAVITISALMLWVVVYVLGLSIGLLELSLFVVGFGLVQWIIAPYIINAVYRVHEAGPELEWLRVELERLAERAGFRKPPRLVVAETRIPNAFAYGNPITGYYVAVTRGILSLMPREELVGVIGHELGHLRHRDVQVLLALGLLPAIVYFVGRTLVLYGFLGGGGGEREEEGSLVLVLLGVLLVAASIVIHFLLRHFNRLREYYADAHSAIVLGSSKPLQRALARLHLAYTSNPRLVRELHNNATASMLFIVNYIVDLLAAPVYDIDSVVEELKRTKTSSFEELFSTHPPVPKRLRFLDMVEESLRNTLISP